MMILGVCMACFEVSLTVHAPRNPAIRLKSWVPTTLVLPQIRPARVLRFRGSQNSSLPAAGIFCVICTNGGSLRNE